MDTNTEAAPANGAQTPKSMTTREGFGSQEMTMHAGVEPQARALAQQLVAQTQARYAIAKQFPRSWLEVRRKLLDYCKIPGFADEAWYIVPFGDNVAGLSIRFAEAAARCMGNLDVRAFPTYEDDDCTLIRVLVEDLESNHAESRDLAIRKIVERSKAKGREVVGTRTNSNGHPTYIVKATKDELRGVINAEVSRAKRNLILAMLPADIRGEAVEAIHKTRAQGDPNQETRTLKNMTDKFSELRVTTSHLAAWLGHPVDDVSRVEIVALGRIYKSMVAEVDPKTWPEIMEARDAELEDLAQKREADAEKKARAKAKGQRVKEEMKAASRAEAQPDGATASAPAAEPTTARRTDILRAAKPLGLSLEAIEEHVGACFDGRGTKDLTPEECAEAIGLLACVDGVADRARAAKIADALPDEMKPLAFAKCGPDED